MRTLALVISQQPQTVYLIPPRRRSTTPEGRILLKINMGLVGMLDIPVETPSPTGLDNYGVAYYPRNIGG